MDNSYKCIILDNGVRLIIVPDNNKSVVTTLVLFGTGSRNEKEAEAGISHVLEHMFYKGTEALKTPIEIAEYIENIGGEHNAFTSKEYTGFYTKVASQYLDRSIEFLSELLTRPLFNSDALEKEKDVIIEELKMYEDLPAEVAANNFERTLFEKSSLGREVIGYRDTILSLKREDLLRYRGQHYTGPNTVIVIAGNINITEEELTNKIKTKFAFSDEKAPVYEKVGLIPGNRTSIVDKPTEQANIVLGFSGASYASDDRLRLKLMSVILGGVMSSRMFTEVREKKGLAYTVRTSTTNYQDTGAIETCAGVPFLKLGEAIRAIRGEYKKILSGIKLDELQKAKEVLQGRMLIALEDTNDIAHIYAMNAMFGTEFITPKGLIQKYRELTLDDVNSSLIKYIKLKDLVVTAVGKNIDKQQIQKIIEE
ncbi:MAG: pitrilysin family protein [Patescibacteria group bacterium]